MKYTAKKYIYRYEIRTGNDIVLYQDIAAIDVEQADRLLENLADNRKWKSYELYERLPITPLKRRSS